MTRSTLPSTAGSGCSKQIDAIAPAVYGPMPGSARMAAISRGSTPDWAMTSIITAYWEDQISMASCSTQPSLG